ncbi:4'-phosphopantetheinyl transferase sfp, partial [Dysosmobacter welbionis]
CRMGMPMGLETAPQVLRGAVPGLFFSASGWNSGTIFQRRNAIMPFQLRPYFPPVFSTPALENAPDAVFRPAPRDGVAPENFHAMSIFPEYFKIAGQWHLARESRMDCVAVWDRGRIDVREFRRLRQGDLVAVGRTEQGEEGILVHPDGFRERRVARDVFAFRQGRSRETAFSRDYDELYELLRHERDHGKVVWVMGPAFAF